MLLILVVLNLFKIKEFEKKNGMKVIEVSAKSSTNVDLAFKTIVENLIERK